MKPLVPLVAATMLAQPMTTARAEVIASDPAGFMSSHRIVIAAPPERVWDTIVRPQSWWSKAHSYSGDAANLSLDPRVGGCWCEKLPGGAVEHARVIHADRGKLLRLSGAFGPLQSGAVIGTLSFALRAEGKGTVVTIVYVVSGFHPAGLASFAKPVDGVFAAQWPALKRAVEAGK